MSHPTLRRHGAPLLTRAASAPRRIWFRLVTRDVDRHGTIIEPAGVDLTSFRANPVFLWMHQSGGEGLPVQPPPDVVIGKVVTIDQTRDYLDFEAEFDDDGADGLASTCYRKVLAGFIRMVSIGAQPTSESVTRVDGVDVVTYPTTELLECSLVIIGSNRGALKLDRAAMAAELRGLGEAAQPTLPVRQRIKNHVATIAVFNHEDAMLWGRRADSKKWTTPGGHLLDGEDPLKGALRELHEEAGIDAAGLQLSPDYLGPVEVTKPGGDVVFVHAFQLRMDRSHATLKLHSGLDPDKEVEEWRWVSLEDGGMLPAPYRDALHAPKNVFRDLGVFRAVARDAATQALLSDIIDDGALSQATLHKSVFSGDGSEVDNEDDDFDIFADDDDGDGIVVKGAGKPLTRGVVTFKSYPMVEGKWDADAAVARWRRWVSSDGSGDKDKIDWGKYAEMFLWFDSSDPHNFSSYKMPHHDIRGGKLVTVWQGVVAAAARIDQAKVPAADLQRMKAHLASHYKEKGEAAPWQRRGLRDVCAYVERAWPPNAKLQARAATYLPTPVKVQPSDGVKTGPAHVPVDENGPYLLAQLTPYALLFPASKFTIADAVVWAKDHGYAGMGAVEVGDGASQKGLVVTENSIFLEQLPASVFQPSPFGPGTKWSTVVFQQGVACVYGVLKTKRLQLSQRHAVAAAYLAHVDATMSPSCRAELVYAASTKRLPDGLAAAVWSLSSLGAVHNVQALYKRDLDRIAVELQHLHALHRHRDADTSQDLSAAVPLIQRMAYAHNAPYYLATTKRGEVLNYSSAPPNGATQMKRTPEARNVMRSLIAHAMEHADMHARAMEDGHIADDQRAMHNAMAMRSLDHAADMQDAYRSVFLGDKASQDIVVDGGEMGVVYGIPGIAEGELKTRFAAVAAKCGKLPVSLRSVVKAELGTDDREIVEEKLMHMKGIVERFAALKDEHARGIAESERIAAEKLITDAQDARLISPAEAKRMRGLDAATGAVLSQGPYTKTRIERFLDERRQSGPIADIARPGAERTANSPVQDMTPGAAKPGLVRFGANRAVSTAPASAMASQIAESMKALSPGIDVASIMRHYETAQNLPNSEAHAAMKNGHAV